MRTARIAALGAALAATACAPAGASTPHTVEPGETLSGIAAANGLPTSAVAAVNGLSPDAQVILGSTIQVPSAGEAPAASAAPAGSGAPPPAGGYTVQPGDTLSGIAASSGVGTSELAWMNGLDPSAPLLAGTALKLPGSTSAPASTSPPEQVADAAPYPTTGQTSSAEISQIAASQGVPGSLAAAIAWQESGFNNGVVSSANARGVMQVMPGTWEWVEQNLSGPLDPSSPQDNVRAGTAYLGQLLRDTGGDERMAVAAYYQGLGSVQQNGVTADTQRYVDNVMALRSRFGG
jgi:soluble lytic murein transglycosylase-like protein